MDNVFITLNDGSKDPSQKWTNGIHRFLTESGAIVEPSTIEQLGEQALVTLQPKIQSGQLTEPELTMALLEAVLPLCPTTASMASMSLRATSSLLSNFIVAVRQLRADVNGGVSLERLRLSVINLNKIITVSKMKIPAIAKQLGEKNSEMQGLKSQASEILDRLESIEFVAKGADKSVDDRFVNLKDLIEAKKLAQDQVDASGKKNLKITLPSGQIITAVDISSSYNTEREARQELAYELYKLKTKMSLVKAAVIVINNANGLFDKVQKLEIEQGIDKQALLDHVENYISSKITLSEHMQEGAQETKILIGKISEFYNTSYSEGEMKQKGLPGFQLIEALEKNDHYHRNYDRLMNLEEIYQNAVNPQRKTQTSAFEDLNTSSISFEQFAKSFPGNALNQLDPDEKLQIEDTFDNINKEPMTWKKGMSIALFSDPPSKPLFDLSSEPSIEKGQYGQKQLVGDSVKVDQPEFAKEKKQLLEQTKKDRAVLTKKIRENQKANKGSDKIEGWNKELAIFDKKISELSDEENLIKQLSKKNRSYYDNGATLGRKLFELHRKNPHWAILFNAIRPHFVNRDTYEKAADQEARGRFEEIAQKTESGNTNPAAKAQIKRQNNKIRSLLEDLDKLIGLTKINDESLIIAAIENDKVPSWILMKAIQQPLNNETRNLAMHNLTKERGWFPERKNGEFVTDESGDYIWHREEVAPKIKKTPNGIKRAPSKAPQAPKADPKAPEIKKAPTKPKKSSKLSFREKIAQTMPIDTNMATNLNQQVDAAKAAKDALAKQQMLLEQQKQQAINAPNTNTTNTQTAAPIAPVPAVPGMPAMQTMQAPPPTGVNNVGVKTFSTKDRLSKRG